MKRNLFFYVVMSVLFLLLTFPVFAGGSRDTARVDLIIGAAMTLRDVADELGTAYMAQNQHVNLTFTYASSGALQTQIEEGAPIDIFISAAPRQMNNLADQGLIYGASRNVVTNVIVLIVPANSQAGVESFMDVGTDKVRMIAFGDPASTPLGSFVQEIFQSYGILAAVNAKANLGSDVRQVLTWVEMEEVDAGIVFMTDAMTSNLVRVVATADKERHSPSVYPVGIVNASHNKDEAQRFIDFLFTSEARAIFERHGFTMF